jgi:hypothetical protein
MNARQLSGFHLDSEQKGSDLEARMAWISEDNAIPFRFSCHGLSGDTMF